MSNQSTASSDAFVGLLTGIRSGQVTVAEIYSSLREHRITQAECENLLSAFEKRASVWERAINAVVR